MEVSIVFAAAMSCIMGNRLLLNIRQTVHGRDDTTLPLPHTARPLTSTRVEFAEMEEMESRA